jgi:putative transport protein
MEWLNALLTNPDSIPHIAIVYATIITLGLALGRVKVKGISLGVIAVLFVGLIFSHFGVKINMDVLGFTRDFGLVLFIFFVGLQVGPSFFSSFKSVGVVLNSLMLLTIAVGVGLTILLYFIFSDTISLASMLGVHYGAITCTPGLGATQEALNQVGYQGEDIAIAYACSYPLGLVTIIGVSVLLRVLFKVDLAEEDRHWDVEEKEINQAPVVFHIYVTNHMLDGISIGEAHRRIPRPFIISRLMHRGEIVSPNAEFIIHHGDTIRVLATPADKMDIVAAFGKEDNRIDISTERSPLTRQRIIVTRDDMNGKTINDLSLAHSDGVNIVRL